MKTKKKINDIFEGTSSENYSISYKYHIVFWSIYFLFNLLRWGSIHDDYLYSFKTNLVGFPIHMALSYFNVYYLMPVFVYHKKYLQYTIAIIISLLAMLLVKFNLTYYFIDTNVMRESAVIVNHITLNYALMTMIGELYVISFATAIKITVDWLGEHQKLHELETKQLKTELQFLRSQVSPHFFFNTLNNIYSLTLEKSDKASETVLKLSELMRYLLYATKRNKQDLDKEIQMIHNYIDLEKIRFDDSLKINFNIIGKTKGKTIAPMLLIPFVENSFKHGANKNIGKMTIEMSLTIKDNFLYFKIANPIPLQTIQVHEIKEDSGIGLNNVKKRLKLRYHQDDYKLDIVTKDNVFNVFLKLKI